MKDLKYADSVLPVLSIEEAQEKQFRLVQMMTKHFQGDEFLSLGDLGVHPVSKRPVQTARSEEVLADFFGTESCALVRGAGTGAIRTLLSALLEPGDFLFIHTAPVYTTTKETLRMLGLKPVSVDYNDLDAVRRALAEHPECKIFYVQHARQQPTDTYSLKAVIDTVKKEKCDLPVVVDDNYCAMKTHGIGVEYGADYSTFSGFKVLGPQGVGVIVGKRAAIDIVRERNYSGGGQVQGFEAMELIRMMTFAPVSLAIQNEQVEMLCERLNQGEVPGIASAYITNSQSKNVIAELKQPIAPQVIERSEQFGAATHPVGAESKYEILPMIYRVSGTFMKARPELKDFGLRVNPMKASAETIIGILKKAIAAADKERA